MSNLAMGTLNTAYLQLSNKNLSEKCFQWKFSRLSLIKSKVV